MKLRQKNKKKTTGVTLLICHDQQAMRDLTFWLPLQQIKHAKWTNSCGRVNSCQQCWLDASQNLWSILNHISLTMAWKPLLWLVIGLCDMMTCDDSKLFFFCRDANLSMTIFFLIWWRPLFLDMTRTQTQDICMKARQTNVENVKHSGVILDRRKDFEPEGQVLSFGLVVMVWHGPENRSPELTQTPSNSFTTCARITSNQYESVHRWKTQKYNEVLKTNSRSDDVVFFANHS